MAVFEHRHWREGGEQPREFGDFWHVALLEENGFGGVEAAREEIEGNVEGVFAALLGVEEGGHRVVICDEVVGFAFVLQFHRRLHHAEIVADVQRAGGLDAG